MALIPLDLVSRQMRLNCRLLAAQGGISAGLGMLLWSISPFISDASAWRYFSLTGGLVCGGVTIYSATQLSSVLRFSAANAKAEERDYIHRIAASQYSQQLFWDTIATTSAEPEVTSTPEIPEVPGETAFPASASASEFPGELVFTEVVEALEAGKSDSHIIQEILGYKGRRYPEGKELLAQVKEAIKSNDNN